MGFEEDPGCKALQHFFPSKNFRLVHVYEKTKVLAFCEHCKIIRVQEPTFKAGDYINKFYTKMIYFESDNDLEYTDNR